MGTDKLHFSRQAIKISTFQAYCYLAQNQNCGCQCSSDLNPISYGDPLTLFWLPNHQNEYFPKIM